MRIRSLKYLIYRDFFLARKTIFINAALGFFLMLFGLLVSLSGKYGNLALVPESYQEILDDMMFMFSCFIPVYACAGVGVSVIETMQFECDKKWKSFRLTTPVSGYMYALARYIVILSAVGVCMGIALLYMWGNSLITGEPVSGKSIAFMLVLTFYFMIFSLLMQILIQVLGSADRAGIAMVILMIPAMFGVMWYVEKHMLIPVDAAVMPFLVNLCAKHLSKVAVIFVIVLVVSFILTAKLYKRREK
ncbi:MAG: ABC-2 transporter permease [Lachnospiraceae bacterium]|nr:ABC-2 transporter permease [Lachnospiraceae bacterium]